jgi:hypothetical protein
LDWNIVAEPKAISATLSGKKGVAKTTPLAMVIQEASHDLQQILAYSLEDCFKK